MIQYNTNLLQFPGYNSVLAYKEGTLDLRSYMLKCLEEKYHNVCNFSGKIYSQRKVCVCVCVGIYRKRNKANVGKCYCKQLINLNKKYKVFIL